MTRNLTHCGLIEGWRELAHDCDPWRQYIAKLTEDFNAEDEREEQRIKNEKHVERELQSEAEFNCDWPGCNFHSCNEQVWSRQPSMTVPQYTTAHPMPTLLKMWCDGHTKHHSHQWCDRSHRWCERIWCDRHSADAICGVAQAHAAISLCCVTQWRTS